MIDAVQIISLLVFYLVVLPTAEQEILKSSTVIMKLSYQFLFRVSVLGTYIFMIIISS